MVPPLALLSLTVAGGLALFATALALPRPAHPPARIPLLALLVALTVLVVRGALLQMDLWTPGAVELALVLATFVAIPVAMVFVIEASVPTASLGSIWRRGLLALPLAVGLAMLLGARGEAGLQPWAWKAYVLGLHAVTVTCAALIWRLHASPARPPWLDAVLLLFALHWLFSSASWTVGVFGLGPNGLATGLEVGSMVSLLTFGAVAVVQALRAHPALQPPAPAPYTRSGLDEDLCRQRAGVLREWMQANRPYLDPELSAAALADALGLTSRELSQVLSTEIGMGFFEFVNTYRIQEATRQLEDPEHAEATILEILYRSGFNSKSAFHRAFKANVGMTPTAYRRENVRATTSKAA